MFCLKRTIGIVVFSLGPLVSLAWGDKGHQIIAEIARAHLHHNTLDSVQFYLRETGFAKAALWMDEIKKNRSFDSLKPRHYINIDRDKTYVKSTEPNIINELDLVIAQLRFRKIKSRSDTKTSLMILFHLIGDLHQPLHVGYGKDKGGNSVHLFYNSIKTNLHRVWDMDIIENEKITVQDCNNIIAGFSKTDKKNLLPINTEFWLNESRSLLRSAYSYKNVNLDSAYISKNKIIIAKQLAIAGLRLAEVLNSIYTK